MGRLCITIILAAVAVTVVHGQPALDTAGACADQLGCTGTLQPNINYGECCGDPARISFLDGTTVTCTECPTVTCYTEQTDCMGGATTTLPRPTSVDACINASGVSFDDGINGCMNLPACFLDVTDCAASGTTSDATGATDMATCCDVTGGGSYRDSAGTCTACSDRCYTDDNCMASTIGDALTTQDECCNMLSGMGFMSNGMCMPCMSPGAGMDPHFAVPLLNGQDMCYSLQGEPYFAFNLVSDPTISINSYFIPPENGKALNEFATFLGDIGILVRPEDCKGICSEDDITKIAISASDRSVLLGGSRTKLKNRHVQVFVENSTATIKLGSILQKDDHPSLTVTIKQPPLAFIVQFVNEHLNLIVKDFSGISNSAHGIMGQFLRRPAEITDDGFLIVNGKRISIEKDDAWEFMHTNTKCLHAKPSHGIQADGIIEGKYTDYIVEGLFSPNFQYNRFKGAS